MATYGKRSEDCPTRDIVTRYCLIYKAADKKGQERSYSRIYGTFEEMIQAKRKLNGMGIKPRVVTQIQIEIDYDSLADNPPTTKLID